MSEAGIGPEKRDSPRKRKNLEPTIDSVDLEPLVDALAKRNKGLAGTTSPGKKVSLETTPEPNASPTRIEEAHALKPKSAAEKQHISYQRQQQMATYKAQLLKEERQKRYQSRYQTPPPTGHAADSPIVVNVEDGVQSDLSPSKKLVNFDF